MYIAFATAPELIDVALNHCGIRKYFSKVFSCADSGVGKEKPDIFFVSKGFFGDRNKRNLGV